MNYRLCSNGDHSRAAHVRSQGLVLDERNLGLGDLGGVLLGQPVRFRLLDLFEIEPFWSNASLSESRSGQTQVSVRTVLVKRM